MANLNGGYKQIGSRGRGQWGSLIPVDPSGLEGARAAREYRKMLKSDTTAGLMYKALSLPVRTVGWQMTPASQAEADLKAAALAWDCLQRVRGGWLALLDNIASMFWAGWSYHYMQMTRRADGKVGFAAIELRPQETLLKWEYDALGNLEGMWQAQLNGARVLIPLARSLLFRTTVDGGDPEGESIYTTARRPWLYKTEFEKVEGRGLFLRWAGFPTLYVPKNITTRAEEGEQSEEARAEAMVEAIYLDKMMGAVLTNDWELKFGGPEGQVDSTMGDTIMRKDMEMARSVLAQFLLLGLRSVGTQALALALKDTFEMALNAYLNSIADVFNRDAIPYLFKYNGTAGMTGLPKLAHASAASLDLAVLGQYVMDLTGAGIAMNDITTANFLRLQVPGMPEVTEDAEAGVPEVDAEDAGGAVGVHYSEEGPGMSFEDLQALTDANRDAQRVTVAGVAGDIYAGLLALPADATTADAGAMLDDLILAAMLAFRERSVLDITAAFWLGFGQPDDGTVPPALQREIALADSWLGYGAGGVLSTINPVGKPTLFGDIAGTLEGQLAAIMLLLKQGDTEEVFGMVGAALNDATRGSSRGGAYAGHVWHSGWAGAVERARVESVSVRWRLDPLAEHCPTCLRFGGEYLSLEALLSVTGGTLPGYGTECDGGCRCSLEALRGGVWVTL